MSQDPQQPEHRPEGAGSYPPPGPYPGGGASYPTGSPYRAAPAPGYGGPPPPQAKNGLGIAALVLGILSIPLAIFFFPIGLILGILAIIFGVIGMGRATKGRATNRGMAIGGLVTGVIGTVIAAIFIVLTIRAVSSCSDRFDTNSPAFTDCVGNEFGT